MNPLQLVERVKQRKLGQWALAYLAGAWLLLQLLSLLAQPFGWPDAVVRTATVVLAIGLLAVLVLAWYHGERGRQRVGGMELLMLAGILVLAGAAVTLLAASRRSQATASAAEPGGMPASMVAQNSIAVLPFANESPDAEQGYFADGLTDELLNVLGELPELRVAARTSSFAFRGKSLPADSVARALHVATLLEGSVRKDGMRVRISADLIDAKTGFTLWRQSFDRDVKDVFQVQDEISHAIVGALQVRLTSAHASSPMAKEETGDAQAHVLLLQGLRLVSERGRPELEEAEALFRQTIQRDPRYARAWASLAYVHWIQAYYRYVPYEAGYAAARGEAAQALRLDSTMAMAHVVLGRIADFHDWNFAASEREFRRAIELNPGLSDAYSNRAWLLFRLGRPREALADATHATELDPLSPSAVNTLAAMYSYSGQGARAEEASREAVALAPRAVALRANLIECLSEVGRDAEAVAQADTVLTLDPRDPIAISVAAYGYGRAGNRARAKELLARLEGKPEVSSYVLAVGYAGLDDGPRVIAALQDAVRRHDDFVTDLGVDPVFSRYRNDPRTLALLKAMGLPAAPVATAAR